MCKAPFTGSYTAQSGEVVGILKNMRDTFESELAAAHAKDTSRAAEGMGGQDAERARNCKLEWQCFSNKSSFDAAAGILSDACQHRMYASQLQCWPNKTIGVDLIEHIQDPKQAS